jgi:ETC complex I subunit conserved region
MLFNTKEEAIAYCVQNGLPYRVFEPALPKRVVQAYADNFAYTPRQQWAH